VNTTGGFVGFGCTTSSTEVTAREIISSDPNSLATVSSSPLLTPAQSYNEVWAALGGANNGVQLCMYHPICENGYLPLGDTWAGVKAGQTSCDQTSLSGWYCLQQRCVTQCQPGQEVLYTQNANYALSLYSVASVAGGVTLGTVIAESVIGSSPAVASGDDTTKYFCINP
jgi:hypothetical protein